MTAFSYFGLPAPVKFYAAESLVAGDVVCIRESDGLLVRASAGDTKAFRLPRETQTENGFVSFPSHSLFEAA